MSPRGRIGRFGRVRRRPDYWSSPHERARTRAAERLAGPLAAGEAAWLDGHLAECDPCREIADAYSNDRQLLRRLRDTAPEPPRDLWARTAAAIERDGASRAPAPRAAGRRPTSLPALSALSGLAVVGVVVVATAISSGLLGPAGRDTVASPSLAAASFTTQPQSTPLAVAAGRVKWLGAAEDGGFAYNVADVDVVCPVDRQPDCPQLADGHARRVALTATPRFVFQSPIDPQAVVVGTDASGADSVIVVALPTPDPTPDGSGTPDPAGSIEPSDIPLASAEATPGQTASPTPLVVFPSDLPSVDPSGGLPSADLASASPSTDVASAPPEPGTAIAIITDVTVVGRSAAYSPDGMWFAFSARPADGSAGPDIYVWRVGDLQARALTTDHTSTFASWVGGNVLGSRIPSEPSGSLERSVVDSQSQESVPDEGPVLEPSMEVPQPVDGPRSAVTAASLAPSPSVAPGPSVEPTPAPELIPQAFLVDPWTGAEVALPDAEWQPVVDPTRLAVVAWQGTVLVDDGLTASPATGNLVVHPFHGPLETEDPLASPSPDASLIVTPEVSAAVSASVDPSASASPDVMRDFPAQIVAVGPIADFDARWDETGTWLAIWIADPVDPGLGRLSLLHFDPQTGIIDRPAGAPQDVTALPGFSIGYGRLAWASPPGQGGEGSRIQIAAWTDDVVGAIESIPVEGAIVVQ